MRWGGKGILIQDEHTGALSTLNNQSICYGISAYESNAMKSSNPHSGIYEADTSRTLDLNGGSQMDISEDVTGTLRAQEHGHQPIVIEGNGARESHRGDGYKESETMFTLNTVEQHAVCVSQDAYDKFSENEKSASLKACGGSYGGGSETMVIQSVLYVREITKG